MKYARGRLAVLALVLTLTVVFLPGTIGPASAADTGPGTPTLYAAIPAITEFSSPDKGRVSDDSYALAAVSNVSESYYGFGFSIPSSCVIDGILITVEANVSSVDADKTVAASVSWDNGTTWTAARNTGALTTVDAVYSLGGATDNWGSASWTPAIMSSNAFRVRLDVIGTVGVLKLDSTQAMVYYSLPDTTTAVATSGSPTTYGDPVTLTATVTMAAGPATPSGTVDFLCDNISIGTGTLTDIGGGGAQAVLTTSALAAGSHAITAVYSGDLNFDGSTSPPAGQVVNRKAITVTADAQARVYGNPEPVLTYRITSGSLVAGDGIIGSPRRDAGEAVGTYAIRQGTLNPGSNYDLAFIEAALTISRRGIAVTADSHDKLYGAADPVLTCQITSGSLAFSDTFTGAPGRVAGEALGTYAIHQGTLALSSNYDLVFVEGVFTIGPPAPTVDGISPASGRPGETINVVIEGGEFAGATAVAFGPGITVNSFAVEGPDRITVSITIDTDAATGARNVTVTTPSGDGTLRQGFDIPGESASWWLWLLLALVAAALGLLLFFLLPWRRKKASIWEVREKYLYV